MNENALFIGPNSRATEATFTIQKLTRGDSLGKWIRHDWPTNSLATRGSQKAKFYENHNNILDDPLNKGATDRRAEN